MTQILQDLATDFSSPDQIGLPLRQVICNTHSPAFFGNPDILSHVLFAHMASSTDFESSGQQPLVTRILPVIPDPLQPALPIPEEVQSYTLSEVQSYLESADMGAARSQLGAHLARDNGKIVDNDKAVAATQTPAGDRTTP